MSDTLQFDDNSNLSDIRQDYLEAIRLIERLHRQFLEVVKTELDNHGIADINNIPVSYTHLTLPTTTIV